MKFEFDPCENLTYISTASGETLGWFNKEVTTFKQAPDCRVTHDQLIAISEEMGKLREDYHEAIQND